jgi:hypothetical protein
MSEEIPTPDDRPSKATFRRRLGLYLLGVAIGCMMLGLFWQQRAMQQQRQSRQQLLQTAPVETPAPSAPAPAPSAPPR